VRHCFDSIYGLDTEKFAQPGLYLSDIAESVHSRKPSTFHHVSHGQIMEQLCPCSQSRVGSSYDTGQRKVVIFLELHKHFCINAKYGTERERKFCIEGTLARYKLIQAGLINTEYYREDALRPSAFIQEGLNHLAGSLEVFWSNHGSKDRRIPAVLSTGKLPVKAN
jgi:hypothetical protein